MPAQCTRTLHAPVRSDDYFDLYLARHVHALGEFRIRGGNLSLDLALALLRTGLREYVRSQCRRQRQAHQYFANPPGSHRHQPSSEWDNPAVEKELALPSICGTRDPRIPISSFA